MLLTRDAILAATALPTEDVDVPEWGGAVRVRGLNALERDRFEQETFAVAGNEKATWVGARARLVSRTVVGEDGRLLFTKQDVEALGKLSATGLNRVWDVAMRLSGMSKADIEELTKNSEDGHDDDSLSA